MVKIALCDDDSRCLKDLEKLIKKWLDANSARADVVTFSDGDALLTACKSIPFDIIFLDVMMPLLNGLDTARELRTAHVSSKIIFLSSSPEFALESYEVKATNYLVKPPTYLSVGNTLRDCLSDFENEHQGIIVKVGTGYQQLSTREIELVEAHNKYVTFFMTDGREIKVSEPLYSFEERLGVHEGFYKTHRSYIVAIPHVDYFDLNKVTTKSQHIAYIARGMGKQFRDAYFAYMFQEK